METEATTKTPIPIHRESVFYLLSPVFCPTLPSFPDCRRSTNVERALQISPFLQNKPNFKIGNINISIATPKAYAKEQRTMSNERYSKQTQSKPIYRARAARPASQPIDCHPFDCAAGETNESHILRPQGTQDDTCGVTLSALRFV